MRIFDEIPIRLLNLNESNGISEQPFRIEKMGNGYCHFDNASAILELWAGTFCFEEKQ